MKKFNVLIILVFNLTASLLSQPTVEWEDNFRDSSGNEYYSDMAFDAGGNIYVTGYSKGSGTSDDDYVTIKYDPSGAEQWIRIYQGPGDAFDQSQSIAVDNYANVYITGRSDGGTVTHYDYATVKYNSSGDSLWVRRYDGSAGNFDYGKSVAADASGNVYVTGQSYYSSSNYDFATVKYNSLGVFQWDRIYDGPGNSADNISSMILDNAGNIYITGSSYLAGENYNYATVKYNSLGIEQWSDIYYGAEGGSDESFSIAADNSGNVYITGSSYAGVEFKNYVTIKYSNGNSPLTLNLTAFIEGFYDHNVNSMISDTARIYLRNNLSPYNIIDSSKGLFSSSGTGVFLFSNALNSVNYYIVIKHRNAVETWSSSGNSFLSDSLSYDFSTSGLKAYGNNMVSVDISPVRYALYSGDIDQDGFVNLTDVINIYNDASGFLTGYNSTDLNGNSIVDLTDLIIAYNNSAGFVSTIIP